MFSVFSEVSDTEIAYSMGANNDACVRKDGHVSVMTPICMIRAEPKHVLPLPCCALCDQWGTVNAQ